MRLTAFAELGLAERLLRALQDAHYDNPTPIQQRAIPLLLERLDLLGIAQTGTGKTAAFALPLLQNLDHDGIAAAPRTSRALILAPTRELALQIFAAIKSYGRHLSMRHAVVIGGVAQRGQVEALRRGVDILVATPGRLLDLVNQRRADLGRCEVLIIDEADRMLDMGFIKDVRKIVAMLPEERQTLLFSATMPAEVAKLAGEILDRPERVEIAAKRVTVEGCRGARPSPRPGREARPIGEAPRGTRAGEGARLHPHQARRRSGGQTARQGRGTRRGAARQ